MNNSEQLQRLYSRLSRRDIEEFYAGYQLWLAEQRLAVLQAEIQALRQQIEQNAERLRQLQPPEGVVNLLTALREWGVSDVVLLDRLCERGEEWLQAMFHRLDTCRQLGLFDGDYTRWCEHALEGAYDWLDSIEEGTLPAAEMLAPAESAALAACEEDGTEDELTEDEFLRRLLREEATAGSLPAIAPAEVVLVDGSEPAAVASPVTAEQAEQAAPAEVVPLSEKEVLQATEAELASGAAIAEAPADQSDGATEAETLERTGEGLLPSDTAETLASEAGLEQPCSSLAEPAMREYASDATNEATLVSESAENQELESEDGAEGRLSSAEQEKMESSPEGAFYEFSPAGSPEVISTAEEVIWPEEENLLFSAGGDATSAELEGDENGGDTAEVSQLAAEAQVQSDAPAEAEAAALVELDEQPQEEEEQSAQVPARSEGTSDASETVTRAGEAIRVREDDEDTAAELRFWQRIFGRHGVELD
ncbi:hypothetical protein KTAU_18470 [Thermogemmatispora aurantia]|uniref:Uncharacterized protein n=1 Tax=Thermogemmatispora aurantia TaxID=2045279 RepID=A0A5J4K947_9CHLR|nr:hypothetical protein [Thermogemmatispora aurantia]GER83210.1 hypothetical protein KTAU_18470 [Thermogemmatispora aurantia]